jgi:sulfatase maturation enzyme AslB (radical SAM superfamily)
MGFNIFLVTNGSRLNDPKIQRAIIDGRRSIHLRVSLDGHSAETHARNHITSPDYFPEIITSITELIRQDVSVSLSYLLHKNVIPELERACKDWKDRHASAVILRPITGMHGIRPYLDYSPSDKEMIKKVKKENNELVHIHPWFLNALENQDNYLVPKSYPVCYSGFYRIAISPTDGTTMTPVEINDNGKKISMVETDKAWISLCTYQRYEKHFGIAFPDDFSSWVQSGRMEKLREIDPAHDCKDIICCRDLYNQQIAELFQQSA